MSNKEVFVDKDLRETIEDLHPKERAIIQVIVDDGCDDYGFGRASTADVRRNTDLDKNDRRYRFETLDEEGVIKIDRDDSLTPNGKPAMKVAALTPYGRAVIDHGGLEGEVYENDEFDTEERIRELEARLDSHDDFIERAREGINERVLPGLRMLHRSVGKLEIALEEDEPLHEAELTDEKLRELYRRLEEQWDD